MSPLTQASFQPFLLPNADWDVLDVTRRPSKPRQQAQKCQLSRLLYQKEGFLLKFHFSSRRLLSLFLLVHCGVFASANVSTTGSCDSVAPPEADVDRCAFAVFLLHDAPDQNKALFTDPPLAPRRVNNQQPSTESCFTIKQK